MAFPYIHIISWEKENSIKYCYTNIFQKKIVTALYYVIQLWDVQISDEERISKTSLWVSRICKKFSTSIY